jgi:hypothetical protein
MELRAAQRLGVDLRRFLELERRFLRDPEPETSSDHVHAGRVRKLLDNQGLYINIHTVNNPGGEILGIIKKQ